MHIRLEQPQELIPGYWGNREGGAKEIYDEIKAGGDFLGFTKQYAFDTDYRVARSALWGLTKASDKELSQLQVLLNELSHPQQTKPTWDSSWKPPRNT